MSFSYILAAFCVLSNKAFRSVKMLDGKGILQQRCLIDLSPLSPAASDSQHVFHLLHLSKQHLTASERNNTQGTIKTDLLVAHLYDNRRKWLEPGASRGKPKDCSGLDT